MQFKDKVVLITGASRGIGAATALAFAKEGANIIVDYFVSDIEPDADVNAKKICETIESFGQKAIMIEADISKEDQVKKLIEVGMAQFGKIDILVNNAGVVFDEGYEKITLEHWNRTLDTDLLAHFLTIKNVISCLSEGGRIVNISSTNGINNFSNESMAYDSAKAGAIVLTKNFAQILAPKNILVNAIAPGWVNTDMNKDLPNDFVKTETEDIWLKRFAEPEEIAELAMFLASDKNTYLTGQVIMIDGGHK
jgi:3-oxoacyl-[acyl-carrier protein] reductase